MTGLPTTLPDGTAATLTNGQTIYLTTDYIPYRDYYDAPPPQGATVVSSAGIVSSLPSSISTISSLPGVVPSISHPIPVQYETVRHHLSSAPATLTGTSGGPVTTVSFTTIAEDGTTVLDHLRAHAGSGGGLPIAVSGASGVAMTASQAYKAMSGLTVDLPSPDSGIGDTITPRDQNGNGLPQVRPNY